MAFISMAEHVDLTAPKSRMLLSPVRSIRSTLHLLEVVVNVRDGVRNGLNCYW